VVQVSCKKCLKKFEAKPSWIKNGHGIYCSSTCQYADARKGTVVVCTICGKESYKQKKALERSKSGKFFCGKSCQTIWRNSEFIQEKHPNWINGRNAYQSVMRRSGAPKLCTLCKIVDIRVLAVHHLDEDRTNNKIENLVWLCHNCHHLVHRYPGEQEKLMATIV
jgi:5-methylcytosine-specific restriction endonuclease McrA